MNAGAAQAAADFDLLIIGGGMVGASLALALARTRCRIAVIEPVLPGVGSQPSFDDRSSALANGSKRILEVIGAWPAIAPHAAAIRRIHVSDAGHWGSAELDAASLKLPALGYTVSNRHIGTALWEALRTCEGITLLAPARVTAVHTGADAVRVEIVDAHGEPRVLHGALAVAADGAQSLARQAAGIAATTVDYHQVAIVANLRAARPADGVAYERFNAHGALAMLPLTDGNHTAVWIVGERQAPGLLAASDDDFRQQLQQQFGWRIGAIGQIGKRGAYPLALTRAQRGTAQRTVLVGNAAQSLHPVAAQGFNLGLRDAALLAELVAGADDCGAPALLAEYEQRRASDRRGMISFTDSLVRLFALSRPGAAELRSLGLLLFDASPLSKQALSRISWGFESRAPRLLRGLPLT